MQIAGLERNLTLCPINQNICIAAFILFGDVELCEAAAAELLKRTPDFDVIVTPEAKSIPLAYAMARQSGKPYVVARKGEKLYMEEVLRAEVQSITTEKRQMLCIGKREKEQLQGKRVLIVDDVISTGESLRVSEKLVEEAGGTVACAAAVLAEGDAADRTDILFLEKLPLFDKTGKPL